MLTRHSLRTRRPGVRIPPGAPSNSKIINHLRPYLSACSATKPGGCGRIAGLRGTHLLSRLDQVGKLGTRVVRRDAIAFVPEEDLAIVKTHSRRSQASTERVFQIVHPDPILFGNSNWHAERHLVGSTHAVDAANISNAPRSKHGEVSNIQHCHLISAVTRRTAAARQSTAISIGSKLELNMLN